MLLNQRGTFFDCARLLVAMSTKYRVKAIAISTITLIVLPLLAGAFCPALKSGLYGQTVIMNSQYASNLSSSLLPDKSYPTVDESADESATKATAWECSDRNDLLAYVRKQMLLRTTDFSIIYMGLSYDNVLTTDTFKDLLDEIFAYDDPNLCTDYDYLRLSWTKADLKSTVYTDRVIYEFSFRYLTTEEEEKELNNEVQEILTSLNVGQLTDPEKVQAVNNYIIENVSFDSTNTNKSAYQAVAKGAAICRGYSMLTYLLLEELSVPARIITGKGNGSPHAWNLVKIGESWYNLDVAWNDTTCSDNFYLKNDKDFYFHNRDSEFMTDSFLKDYPIASASYKAKQTPPLSTL